MIKDISKVIFLSDMDGTLLSEDKTLCKRNADAIKRFRQAGGIFVVATGRVIQSTERYLASLGLDCPAILCNGGMIYDCMSRKVMWAEYLDVRSASEMITEIIEKFPMVCAEICTPTGIYDVNINETERIHMVKGGFTALPVASLDDVPRENWSKVLFAVPEEHMKDVVEFCDTLELAQSVEFVTSSVTYHEMLPKGCSKGSAMLKLKSIYGCEDSVLAAMGDYNNDLEMLKAADISACPSNAIDEVKAVCGIVCDLSCGEGAVAQVIEDMLAHKIKLITDCKT